MASVEMSQDMIIEILSHSPASVVEKFRILNKDCNKRTYNSSFLKASLQRTNTISGYFLEYRKRLKISNAFFKEGGVDDSQISLDFLPIGRIGIKACDASHGILLCINERPVRGKGSVYIVCKPTTKQYVILPKPKTKYFTIALGLMVIGSNPFRYKILRLSKLPEKEKSMYNFNFTMVCEVFDSDSFVWKRLSNVELQGEDVFLSRNSKPVASCGCLHWLLTDKNVFRFCFKTETWSIIPVPENLARYDAKLTRYEGKLGIMSSRSKEGGDYQEIWVLISLGNSSWVKVKDIETIELEAVGFSSNDVVILVDLKRICLYNMNNGKCENLEIRTRDFYPYYCSTISCFALRSDFERVELGGRSNDYQSINVRDKSLQE